MGDAKQTLELFMKLRFVFDALLVVLFLTTGFFGLTLVIPFDIVLNTAIQSLFTIGSLVFGVGCIRLADNLTDRLKIQLEQAVEDEKSDEERAAPVIVNKKSVGPAPSNILKTTRVVLKSNAAAAVAAKRGRPKKEG